MFSKFLFAAVVALFLAENGVQAVIYCFEAPSIPNSVCYKDQVVMTEDQMKGVFAVGDRVTYRCLPGYTIRGTSAVTCQPSGSWTTRPICDLITTKATTTTTQAPTCPSVPVIENGLCDAAGSTVFRNNQQVQCSCSPGYKLSNNGWAKCNNANWINVPTCIPAKCDGVPTFDNGACKVNANGVYPAGQSIECSCNEGYRTTGGKNVMCQQSGQWAATPTCSRIMCFAAPSIANSECYQENNVLSPSAMAAGVYMPNEAISYKCLEGFVLNGEAKVTCQADGTWTKLPSCDRVCVGVPKVENGNCEGSSSDGNYRANQGGVTCSCNAGFRFGTGSASASRCGTLGQWINVPTCVPLPTTTPAATCKGTPVIDFGKCTVDNDDGSGVYTRGSRSTCVCNEGYKFPASAPTATTVCNAQGLWNKVANCSEIPTCKMLPQIANGVCGGSSLPVAPVIAIGGKVTCTCNEGFQAGATPADKTAEITCRAKDAWTTLPRCTAVRTTTIRTTTTTQAPKPCPVPPQIEGSGCDNCGANSRSFVFMMGDQVRYTCRDGFVLSGNAFITCQRDGTWTQLPKCEVPTAATTTQQAPPASADVCPPPPAVDGAGCDNCQSAAIRGVVPVYNVGDQIRYTCRPGYKLPVTSNGMITCLKGGVWSTAPTCTLISPEASTAAPAADKTTSKPDNGDMGNHNGQQDTQGTGNSENPNNNNNNSGTGNGGQVGTTTVKGQVRGGLTTTTLLRRTTTNRRNGNGRGNGRGLMSDD